MVTAHQIGIASNRDERVCFALGRGGGWVCLLFLQLWSLAVNAEVPTTYDIDLPSQPLIQSLKTLSDQTHTQILYPYRLVEHHQAPAVRGRLTVKQTLHKLLGPAGLVGLQSGHGIFAVASASRSKQDPRRKVLDRLLAFLKDSPSQSMSNGRNAVTEEILVTAQKREQALQEVPISLRVLSAGVLDTIGADRLESLTRVVPSLSITDFQRGSNNVQIRGLGSNVGNVGTVAIYNDGVISVNRLQANGIFAEQDTTLFDIERVEVLRGPQGTLYGEGSFGGVINIISRRPDLETFAGSVSFKKFEIEEGSSNNSQLAAMVNVPLLEKRLALRLVGFDNEQAGFIDAYSVLPALDPENPQPPQLVGEDLNWERTRGGRAMIGFRWNELQGQLIHKRERLRQGINKYTSRRYIRDLFAHTGTPPPDSDLVFPLFRDVFGREQRVQEDLLQLDWHLPFATLSAVSGYGDIVDVDNTFRSQTRGWSQELRLASEETFPWILGLYFREASRETQLQSEQALLREDFTQQWSLFGEAAWPLTDDLRLILGIRYSEQESRSLDHINADQLGDLYQVKERFTDTSPKIGIDWQHSDGLLFYLSASKGFRAGGVNTDFSLGQDAGYVRSFRPDEVWNYELGLKRRLLQGQGWFNLAVFYIDWDKVQIDRPIQDNITANDSELSKFITVNGEGAHSFGAEADLNLNLTSGWTFSLGASLIQAQFDSGTILSPYRNTQNPDGIYRLQGMRLPNAPEYLLNLGVERSFQLSYGLQGYLRWDYSLRGHSYADVPNQASGVDFNNRRFEVSNFFTGLRGDWWDLQLFVRNLEDVNASTMDWYDGSFDFRAQLTPRTIGLGLSLHYR